MKKHSRKYLVAVSGIILLAQGLTGHAEPYLSVRSGQPCHACHGNGTGGGLRTAFGSAYALEVLSERGMTDQALNPEIGVADGLRLGGNARYSARQFEQDDTDGNLEFATDRVSLYGQLQLNQVVDLYVDEQVAPGGSLNREAWARLSREQWYLKLGKFFLPYGWRLEDDTTFVRQATGINFATPDNGLELGYAGSTFQAQMSVTNGAGGGGSETDDGKFFLARGNYISRWGQLGLNAGFNDSDAGDRTLLGLTAGTNTGPLAWLLAYDRIVDSIQGAHDEEQDVALLEANWLIVRGHNLKFTMEWQDPDTGEERKRGSLVWEYFPWAYTQLRVGIRAQRSDNPRFVEGEEYFLQAHVYF